MQRDLIIWKFIFFLAWSLCCGIAGAQSYDSLRAGVVRVSSSSGYGTGFIFRIEKHNNIAWVITASHVVEGDQQPKLEFFRRPGDMLVSTVIKQEPGDDNGLAVLKLNQNQNLPDGTIALTLADQDLKIDDRVLVMGFPVGIGDGNGAIPNDSQVSASQGKNFVLNGTFQNGNSGSPVFKEGLVGGIVTTRKQGSGIVVPISIIKLTLRNWLGSDYSNGDSQNQAHPPGTQNECKEIVVTDLSKYPPEYKKERICIQ